MVLDLTRLFEEEGGEVPFSASVDLSGYEVAGVHPVPLPARVEGKASNTAGVVTVAYRVGYTLDMPCDRCLDPVSRERALRCALTAVRALSGDEEEPEGYLVLPDAMLDLSGLVRADVALDLPGKVLCREDCRGLCPVCGTNLNHHTCGCGRKPADPRWQALQGLLEGEDGNR